MDQSRALVQLLFGSATLKASAPDNVHGPSTSHYMARKFHHCCRQMVMLDKSGPRKGLSWSLTVDSTERASYLQAEYILNGEALKIGVNAQTMGARQ